MAEDGIYNIYEINRGERGIGCGRTMSSGEFFPRPSGKRVLEVGFGQGELVRELAKDNYVCAVDVGLASMEGARNDGFENDVTVCYVDASKERLPWPDNWFDIVYCTEAIEHMSAPLHMVTEVKRVLIPDGHFILSIPDQNVNYGYGGGVHAWVYPGLGIRKYFVQFFRQLWFACIKFQRHGGSAMYAFENVKRGKEDVNVFTVVAGNYNEEELYAECFKREREHGLVIPE